MKTESGQLVKLELLVQLNLIVLDGDLLLLVAGVSVEFFIVILGQEADLLLEVIQLALACEVSQLGYVFSDFLVVGAQGIEEVENLSLL